MYVFLSVYASVNSILSYKHLYTFTLKHLIIRCVIVVFWLARFLNLSINITPSKMNWYARFQDMVKELSQHTDVELLDSHVFAPLENSQIDLLEKNYNVKIPDIIRELYKITNGLQLRWMLKSNENFSKEKYPFNNENLPWNYFQQTFRFEDGGILLLPLEIVLENKVLDAFSSFYAMQILDNDFQLTLSEEEMISENTPFTDVESYLEFLLASKGLVSRRSFFYDKKIGTQLIQTPLSFWTENKILHLDQASLKNQFPLIDQVSYSESQINHPLLWQAVQHEKQISQKEIESIIEKHQDFLMSGGAKGIWKVIELKGLVTAFYENKKEAEEGVQANFERKNISNLNFSNTTLPFSNFCAVHAANCDFQKSDLSHALFSDAFLHAANFSNSNLANTDFSRSNLQNANFENAMLSGCDFENCDLRRANFEGAKMDGARFPGSLIINSEQ